MPSIDFQNPLFRLKPSTLNINQPNTALEGAIRGKIRISETGQQFDEMSVTLLKEPIHQRSYYTGKAGTLNRLPENLVCFSKDLVYPDKTAKDPQAYSCANCKHGDAGWAKWRETHLKEDIPQCDAYYYAVFIDTVYKMPLQMFIRSKNKKPFEAGMENVSRLLYMLEANGQSPNIYDIKFKLTTKKITTNNLPSYVINLSDFEAISEEDKASFGKVYENYTNRQDHPALPEESEVQASTAQAIEKKVAEIEYVGGDITA